MAKHRQPSSRWFAERGWKPFTFQKAVWQAVAEGESGLLHAATGAGKTYAVWFAALDRFAGQCASCPHHHVAASLPWRR